MGCQWGFARARDFYGIAVMPRLWVASSGSGIKAGASSEPYRASDLLLSLRSLAATVRGALPADVIATTYSRDDLTEMLRARGLSGLARPDMDKLALARLLAAHLGVAAASPSRQQLPLPPPIAIPAPLAASSASAITTPTATSTPRAVATELAPPTHVLRPRPPIALPTPTKAALTSEFEASVPLDEDGHFVDSEEVEVHLSDDDSVTNLGTLPPRAAPAPTNRRLEWGDEEGGGGDESDAATLVPSDVDSDADSDGGSSRDSRRDERGRLDDTTPKSGGGISALDVSQSIIAGVKRRRRGAEAPAAAPARKRRRSVMKAPPDHQRLARQHQRLRCLCPCRRREALRAMWVMHADITHTELAPVETVRGDAACSGSSDPAA